MNLRSRKHGFHLTNKRRKKLSLKDKVLVKFCAVITKSIKPSKNIAQIFGELTHNVLKTNNSVKNFYHLEKVFQKKIYVGYGMGMCV